MDLPQAFRTPGCFSRMPRQRFKRPRRLAGRPLLAVLAAANRHVAADLIEYELQAFLIERIGRERQARGHHAAADVHPHRGRDDGPMGGDRRPDRGPDPSMHIGHRRDMVMHEGQGRDVQELLARRALDLVGIDLDRDAAFGEDLLDRHDPQYRKNEHKRSSGRTWRTVEIPEMLFWLDSFTVRPI